MTCEIYLLAIIGLVIISVRVAPCQTGNTEITKWQYGKTAAVSLTYDDGSINQFRIAVPIIALACFGHVLKRGYPQFVLSGLDVARESTIPHRKFLESRQIAAKRWQALLSNLTSE